ncbi:MAG: FtsX-like permease family protein [Anaerolineae bacterium]|nr:FtsX-like permease family protein [Anaerolineae bacterium]
MSAILLKVKADIVGRALISTLIVITITAASALLTLALATLMNMDAPYDRAFEALNGAHLWIYLDREVARPRDVERIEQLPGVVASTGVQYSVDTRVQLGEARVWVSLRVIPPSAPDVNRLLIREGRTVLPGQDELLASKDLNDLYQLEVGDTIQITRQDGKELDLPVVGLAYNPTWDTYRNSQPPYLYVGEDTMRALYPDESTWDRSVGLRLADPDAVGEMVALIEASLRPEAVAGHTDWRDVKSSAIFAAALNLVFLGAFGFFAILATILVITSSVSSMVLSQFRQIGMLKAIGFTQSQVFLLYVGQYLILGLIGGALGVLLGIVLSPLPLKNVAASLSTTFRPPVDGLLIATVLGAIALTTMVATVGTAYRGARANIVKVISVGAEAPRQKGALAVRWATRLGLPVIFVLGLNDVFARPFRSLLIGLNLALGVIGIVFGLALNETLDRYRKQPELLGIVYDALVSREKTSHTRVVYYLSRAPGVERFYGEQLIAAETLDRRSFQVRAVEGDLTDWPFQVTVGRFLQPDTFEAMAGQGLLDWLGLSVGDEITLVLDGVENRPLTWRIVGQYSEPVNTGQMLIVNLSTVTRALGHVEPSRYYLRLAPGADPDRLKAYLSPRPDADLNLIFVEQAIPDQVYTLQLAILALGGILIGMAVINVFNTSLLSVQEKLRTIGVLKTIGMTPNQVVAMVTTTAGLLGFLAAVVGLPVGFVFTKGVLASLASTYGFGQVQVSLSLFYVLVLPPALVGISVLGSLIPGRRAAGTSIVGVLRRE